jgi:hypothetical protein
MEPDRFDQILRQFATGSRRGALKVLAGGSLGALGVRLGLREVAAACAECSTQPLLCFQDPVSPTESFCCKGTAGSLCYSPERDEYQCCYNDEVCKPGRANEDNGYNLCCRTCRRPGGRRKCCPGADKVCRNGRCKSTGFSRPIRKRT